LFGFKERTATRRARGRNFETRRRGGDGKRERAKGSERRTMREVKRRRG
jgi:hypothetical protein